MWQKLVKGYSTLGVILLNLVVMFGICNLVLAIVYQIIDQSRPTPEDIPTPLYISPLDYGSELLAKLYPTWKPEELDRLLGETYSRPLRCAPFVQFRESPYEGKYINVDPVGFRYNTTPDLALPRLPLDEKAWNIFVFGGSTTFGYGVADFETIPAYLEQQFQAMDLPREIRVYNFGQGFFFSSQEVILLWLLIQQGYIPDMVVFIDGVNEHALSANAVDPVTISSTTCRNVATASTEQTVELPIQRLADSVRYRILGIAKEDPSAIPTPSVDKMQVAAQRGFATWTTNRQIIQGIADHYGMKALFVWQPAPFYHYDRPDLHPTNLQFNFETGDVIGLYSLIEQTYQQEKWDDFLWLADIQLNKTDWLYVDQVHYNAAFNTEIATYINEYILSNGWLLESQ